MIVDMRQQPAQTYVGRVPRRPIRRGGESVLGVAPLLDGDLINVRPQQFLQSPDRLFHLVDDMASIDAAPHLRHLGPDHPVLTGQRVIPTIPAVTLLSACRVVALWSRPVANELVDPRAEFDGPITLAPQKETLDPAGDVFLFGNAAQHLDPVLATLQFHRARGKLGERHQRVVVQRLPHL